MVARHHVTRIGSVVGRLRPPNRRRLRPAIDRIDGDCVSGSRSRTTFAISSVEVTARPSIETMTSPSRSPALAAAVGEDGDRRPRRASRAASPSWTAAAADVDRVERGAEPRALVGRLAADLVDHGPRLVDRDREADVLGAAGARGGRVDADQPAARSRRAAPPELPGLIAASVWSRPSSDGAAVRRGSVRSRPETMPWVTVGPPPRPSGKPIASTPSPSRSCDERPSGDRA